CAPPEPRSSRRDNQNRARTEKIDAHPLEDGVKLVEDRPSVKPEVTARRLLDIADAVGPDAQGRIFVERVSAVFLNEGGDAYAYRTGIALLKRDGSIDMHDSGTFFRVTPAASMRHL